MGTGPLECAEGSSQKGAGLRGHTLQEDLDAEESRVANF